MKPYSWWSKYEKYMQTSYQEPSGLGCQEQGQQAYQKERVNMIFD